METAQVTETGHAKNLSNFESEITGAISFGEDFNPSKPELTVPEMQKLSSKCGTAILNVSKAKAAYKNALDARNTIFTALNKLCTRIINAMKASATTDHMDKNARELVRKIQGTRAKPRRTEEEKKADAEAGITYSEISASQMSYDSRANNLQELLQLLAGIPEYKPNEKDLQLESLNKYKDDLKTKNAAVFAAIMALNNARAVRNDLMYKPVTGMVDIALDVKSYIKSVFGPSSLQYKRIAGLEFTKINK